MLRWRVLAGGLFISTWLIAVAGAASTAADERDDSWRQTSQGWQRCEEFLAPPVEYRQPAIHPLVVGALEVLLTTTAMLALSGERRRATARNRHLSD